VADADSDWSVMVGFVRGTLLITVCAYGLIQRQFCVCAVLIRVNLAAYFTGKCVHIYAMRTPNLSTYIGHVVYIFAMIARRVFTDSPLALWIVFLPDFIAVVFSLFVHPSSMRVSVV
tara:strand:+ start:120 stop:470 length:351 start_codon:yes stop_codon:yes gene_type:complete